MGSPTLGGCGRVEHSRPHERVAKADSAVRDGDQPGILGRLEGGELNSQGRQRPRHRLELGREGDGGHHQGAPGVDGERLGAPGKGAFEGGAGRNGLRQRLASGEPVVREEALRLEQSQWVPLRRLPQPVGDLGGDDLPVILCEQRRGLLRADSTELEPVDPGRIEGAALTVPDGEEHRGRVCDEPLGGEEHGFRGRAIEPLGVVHDHEERARLGCRGEHAQRRRADREAVVLLRLAEPQRATQRLGLLGWDLRKVLEERSKQLEEAGELQLGLGLDAERAHDRHPLRLLDGIFQQGRLADPGLAAHDEGVAATQPRSAEQRVDEVALAFSTDEPGN
jgi:hypothetical protein